MICLKNRTFAVYKTTGIYDADPVPGCDLLEKSYLCGIQNNQGTPHTDSVNVVICLKNRTFAVYKTTNPGKELTGKGLWFAWKIVPLRYTKQPSRYCTDPVERCDLLEKSYLCGIQNNRLGTHKVLNRLWFAWKIVPLRYTKQLPRLQLNVKDSCDLLEKSYLCGIQNNSIANASATFLVVICLKNRTFAVYKTTTGSDWSHVLLLWFAWKIVPLRYTKQRQTNECNYRACCDLLEKSYLCGIQNNFRGLTCVIPNVVICLKNRTFAVYKTTKVAER